MAKRKWLKILSVLVILTFLSGCSNSKSTPKVQDDTKQSTESNDVNPQSTVKLGRDENLTKQIEAEKGIESVMVQVVEGQQPAVNSDIVINNEQELSPDQVAEKYSKVIKEKYPNHSIDIMVIKEGKIVKHATFK
ncbi:hypothetical protein Desor_5306 [Desulfosporosinus orientis DSM 765]|uniref:Lipoprotein n=1 Tax=Desulfosporosinus orientis (strain ATCC 19365 / DSM 765 / NCIMB 8382 / VKM B-1628 / Singapore I) TaxID=768706 RepID=G7WC67_DESOD|nr:hypothetical protein [Desulfosporosinus orientis]AET70685.1 hypothetical protein Desor_5306 [Desulfosporosinus orientis DSM 765]